MVVGGDEVVVVSPSVASRGGGDEDAERRYKSKVCTSKVWHGKFNNAS